MDQRTGTRVVGAPLAGINMGRRCRVTITNTQIEMKECSFVRTRTTLHYTVSISPFFLTIHFHKFFHHPHALLVVAADFFDVR
jgi:hypothetical protein